MVLEDIKQILRILTSSSIPRSKLHRFEMLLKDIRSNRFRVYDIIHRMNPILSDPNRTAKDILRCLKKYGEGRIHFRRTVQVTQQKN